MAYFHQKTKLDFKLNISIKYFLTEKMRKIRFLFILYNIICPEKRLNGPGTRSINNVDAVHWRCSGLQWSLRLQGSGCSCGLAWGFFSLGALAIACSQVAAAILPVTVAGLEVAAIAPVLDAPEVDTAFCCPPCAAGRCAGASGVLQATDCVNGHQVYATNLPVNCYQSQCCRPCPCSR